MPKKLLVMSRKGTAVSTDGRLAQRHRVFVGQVLSHPLLAREAPNVYARLKLGDEDRARAEDSTSFLTAVSMPLMIEAIAITVQTPITTPITVSNERSLFARSVASAIIRFS